ncbi:hypothetical protein [Paraburkholderia sediminicola]|uniref:hypothetical protein n=1 Tax=Paraburkholderia sediminicola TaxID=458836 RepID=UPI0038BC54C9
MSAGLDVGDGDNEELMGEVHLLAPRDNRFGGLIEFATGASNSRLVRMPATAVVSISLSPSLEGFCCTVSLGDRLVYLPGCSFLFLERYMGRAITSNDDL